MAFFKFFKPKVGVAFGGGGTKGFAHVGVVKALEEMGVKPNFIAGTSAGAIIGALVASGKTYNDLLEMSSKVNLKAVKTSIIPLVPNKSHAIENLMIELFGKDLQFEELSIPLVLVAVDVKTGAEVHLKSGSVAKAVSASCAYPGVFTAVEIDDHILFDGGLLNNIPANVPKLYGCDNCIGIDINSGRGSGTESSKYFDQLMASIRIMMKSNSLKGYLNADVMIQANTKQFRAMKNAPEAATAELIEIGYAAAIAQKDEILKTISTKNYLEKKNKKQKAK